MIENKNNHKAKKYMLENIELKYKKGRGMAKKPLKDKHNSTPYIHSSETYKTYVKQVTAFANWCIENGYNKTPELAFEHVPDYLKLCEEKGQKAHTIQTKMNAIAKAFGVSTLDIDYTAPKRLRSEITRSRGIAKRDVGFSLKNPENQLQNALGRSFGLRRAELDAIHWEDLVKRNGVLCMKIVKRNGICAAKGGKERVIEFHGTEQELKIIEKAYKNCGGEGKCVARVHSHLDEHANRAMYACRCYKAYAQEEIPQKDKYICRKDKKGVIYDRQAMLITSRNLGHNRIDVIASNYLYGL